MKVEPGWFAVEGSDTARDKEGTRVLVVACEERREIPSLRHAIKNTGIVENGGTSAQKMSRWWIA